MQSRAFLLCAIAPWLVLPACGLVSGLDTLHTNDAAADATTADASSDASDDVAINDSSTPDAIVVADGGSAGVKCGTQTCVSLVCCITLGSTNQYTCQKDGCNGNTTYVLRCDDKSDCLGSSGTCCFANSTASCGPSIGCSSLCNSDNQCATGMKCNPFDAGAGLSLSRCE